jgi:hypothetical protein
MDNNRKEEKVFGRAQFEQFLIDNDYEAFIAKQVAAFATDVLNKSENNEMDEFEKACAAADWKSLETVKVLNDLYEEEPMFIRPSQVEVIPGKEGIFKSMSENRDMLRYKETPLNIFKGIAGMCVSDDIEKARKGEPIGTVKSWGGKEYVKTANGWVRRQGIKTKETAKEDKQKGKDGFPTIEKLVVSATKSGHNPKEAERVIREHYEYLKKKYPEASPSKLVHIAYTIS